MNLLAFINIFLAGQKLSSLWLMPVAIGSALITVNYLQRLTAAERPVVSFVDLCVLAYFFYSILSVGLYVQPSNPASPRAYLYGVNLQIMPMLMYFSVKGLDSEDMDRILKFIVVLHVAFALIGIFLFFSRPNFYAEYLIDTLGFTDTWQIYARLQSYWGSTATGILSAVTIVLLPNINVSRLVRNLLLVLFLVTIFLAQQRGAYMSGVLATAGDKSPYPGVPTFKELGFTSGIGQMTRVVMAPRGMPEERKKALWDAFVKLNKDKTYLNLMKQIGENTELMSGEDYEKLRVQQKADYKKLVDKLTK